jgi:hypothetical protein
VAWLANRGHSLAAQSGGQWVKRFGLVMAFFWSLQGGLCLAPAALAGERASLDSTHAVQHAAPATGCEAPGMHEHVPSHGEGPTPNGQCAEQCVSISQALTAAPVIVPGPPHGTSIAVLPAPSIQRSRVGSLAAACSALGPSPPADLVLRNASLRI